MEPHDLYASVTLPMGVSRREAVTFSLVRLARDRYSATTSGRMTVTGAYPSSSKRSSAANAWALDGLEPDLGVRDPRRR